MTIPAMAKPAKAWTKDVSIPMLVSDVWGAPGKERGPEEEVEESEALQKIINTPNKKNYSNKTVTSNHTVEIIFYQNFALWFAS